MQTTNEKNGNGSSEFKPEKIWNFLGKNSWWEEQPEIPGQDKIIEKETLEEELFGDDDADKKGDFDN